MVAGDGGKVTIRDVAVACGVSPSTVSRAFAKPDRLSASTVRRIREAADALGYHTRAVTTVPRRGQRHTVAVIVPDVANQFLTDLIRAAERECEARGLGVIIAETRENAARERIVFDHLNADVDGVLLASSRMPDAMIRKCAQACPVVLANREVRGVDSVVIDLAPGIGQLVDHAVGQGFRSVTYLDGLASSWSASVRWNQLSKAFSDRGASVRRFRSCPPTYEGGARQVERYLEQPTELVIAHNDMMALGFIAAMRRHGCECPKDVAVIGFDNTMSGQLGKPSLTSVHTGAGQLGDSAARLLLDRIEGASSGEGRAMRVRSSLIVRESTLRQQVRENGER